MSDKMYNLLLKSFDTDLSDDEQIKLETALKQSAELRFEKDRLLKIRHALRHVLYTRFQPFFADRVIARIQSVKTSNSIDLFFESLKTAFRTLVIPVALLIIGFMSYNAIHRNQSFLSSLFPQEEASLEQALDPAWTFFQE
ncbi:hypothetical protein JW835_00640 [bacterium]|nr:hypothetical protein [bacterium]